MEMDEIPTANEAVEENKEAVPVAKETIPADQFRLGITMAGAASAGCYTGGVMDYLFQILDTWNKAKQGQLEAYKAVQHLIPTHSVVIDAMGGTSAGGMTATMSAVYALNGQIKPVTQPGNAKEWKDNLFYDSWVVMEDLDPKDKRDTFDKLFDTDDMADGKVRSLLNSAFIDAIANRCFAAKHDIKTQTDQLPPYISKNLQLLLSHCLLRGIPLDVNFETPISKKGRKSILPNHTTYEHYVVSQYHLNQGTAPDPEKYLWLNPYEAPSVANMQLSTKATGAFPAGLLYREFTVDNFNKEYLENVMKRIALGQLGTEDPDPEKRIKLKYLKKGYSSFTVDGGAINNEPYREVMSLLKDKYVAETDERYPQFGVVMIDPFPDQGQFSGPYEKPTDLLDVVPSILGALTDQARVKRRELLENDSADSFRSIIFPRRWTIHRPKGQAPFPSPEKHPIASAGAMAFAGLLDIQFRQHDFFLGRNNARNFFRYWFSFPYDEANDVIHPIHRTWTPAMRQAFAFRPNKRSDDLYLPIIPDIQLLLEPKPTDEWQHLQLTIDKFPLYDADRLFRLRPAMTSRFLKIIELLKDREGKKEEPRPLAEAWIDQYAKKGWFARLKGKLGNGITNMAYKMGKKPIAEKMTDAAISMILKDLEKTGCLAPVKGK